MGWNRGRGEVGKFVCRHRTFSCGPCLHSSNRKTVMVENKNLLPTEKSDRVLAKRVDYGLFLRNNPQENEKIIDVRRGMEDGFNTISQCNIPMLQKRSLFCNMEIKMPFGGQDPGPQLGVWCCAGFNKLASLCRESRSVPEDSIPSLPCWTVDGHRWRLYMSRRRSPGEIVHQLFTVCNRLRALTLNL